LNCLRQRKGNKLSKKTKFSLSKIFLSLLFISVLSLLLLGSFALFFNYRMGENQQYLTQAASLETSRFTMSDALTRFLSRQSTILSKSNVEDLAKLPSRKPIEVSFEKGLSSLSDASQNDLTIKKSLNVIEEVYKKFLISDEKVLSLERSLLNLKQELQKKTGIVDDEVKSTSNLIDEINGTLFLQNEKTIGDVLAFLNDKALIDDKEKLKNFESATKNLLSSTYSNSQYVSQKLITDMVNLTALMHLMISDSNQDVLNDIVGNKIPQLIELIKREIHDLNDFFLKYPDFAKTSKKIEDDFNIIVGQLIKDPQNIAQLQKEYDQGQIELENTINQIQTYLLEINNQFDQLNTIITQLKETLLATVARLALQSRIAVITTVFGFLLFILIIGYYLERAISQSLNFLISGMKKIAEEGGDLSYRLPSTKYEDLNEVVVAFNKMTANLDYTQGHLHELVESRTEELSNANTNLGVLVDQLREAKIQADSANKIKSQFIANMSHELRTPLNAIIGYSEMMLEEAEEEQKTENISDYKKIIGSGKHLLSLINDVLDLSKIEAGKIDIFLEDVVVADLLKDIQTIISPLLEKNTNAFKMNLSDEPKIKIIHSDFVRIKQSLLNLLSNSSKFTKNGTITLTTAPLVQEGKEWI